MASDLNKIYLNYLFCYTYRKHKSQILVCRICLLWESSFCVYLFEPPFLNTCHSVNENLKTCNTYSHKIWKQRSYLLTVVSQLLHISTQKKGLCQRKFFLHSHHGWEGISFMWKVTFGIFIKSLPKIWVVTFSITRIFFKNLKNHWKLNFLIRICQINNWNLRI